MTKKSIAGNALVYCQGAFNTPEGKTAHGLVRFTERYDVFGILDSNYTGQDAGKVLDNRPNGIPIFPDLVSAIAVLEEKKINHCLTTKIFAKDLLIMNNLG